MSRWFRLWEKKRGDRWTVSKWFGGIGEAAFFAAIFLLGSAVLAVLVVSLAWHSWPANRYFRSSFFEETLARIEDRRLATSTNAAGQMRYRPEFLLALKVDGEMHRGWKFDAFVEPSPDKDAQQAYLARFEVGETYPLWYDRANVSQVSLREPSNLALWLTFSVVGSIIVLGGAGLLVALLRLGTSTERRAALASGASGIAQISEALPSPNNFPGIPRDLNQTNSPGITLQYRLPTVRTPSWHLAAAGLFSLAWNAVVVGLIIMAVRSHLYGPPEWLLTIFVFPFLAVGLWSVYYFVRLLLITTGIGPTIIEISDHPLRPAESYDVFLSQSGRFSVNSLEVLLTCDEEATYRQGTNSRVETSPVHEQLVYFKEEFNIEPAKPFEHQWRLEMPKVCMHSFQSDHNAIRWKLLVRGDVAGWPPFERSFPILVYPPVRKEAKVGTAH